jgi:hypothetical protein
MERIYVEMWRGGEMVRETEIVKEMYMKMVGDGDIQRKIDM